MVISGVGRRWTGHLTLALDAEPLFWYAMDIDISYFGWK
jgi:hypothetical protein